MLTLTLHLFLQKMDLTGNALRANLHRPNSGNKLRRPETDFAKQR
jgi:hypothetical protein